jgi:hypothetical protein
MKVFKAPSLFNIFLLVLLIQTSSISANLLKTKGGVFCDVKNYSKVNTSIPECKTLSQKMGYLAKILAMGEKGLVTETTYSHNVLIDGEKGIFYSNCSCFVSYIVNHISPAHLDSIPKDSCVKPAASRAWKWSAYFAEGDAATGKSKLWEGITRPEEAKEGDVLAWGFTVDNECKLQEGKHDTGHVMIITKGPQNQKAVTIDKARKWAYIWVADASNVKHLPDTNFGARYSDLAVFNKKNPGKTSGDSLTSGIGLGQVKIGLRTDGTPNGNFVLQKKEGTDSKVGIGRAI